MKRYFLYSKIKSLEYYRKPTEWEIMFGYGAIHYRDFEASDCLKKDGSIKKRIIADDDGLCYVFNLLAKKK